MLATIAGVAALTALTGCAGATAASSTPVAAAAASPLTAAPAASPATGIPNPAIMGSTDLPYALDPNVALTCAVDSIAVMNLHNAQDDEIAGTITDSQRVAIINAVADDIVFFAQRPGVALHDQLEKAAALIKAGPTAADSARFEPESTEWSDIQFAISNSCDANGSSIVISSNTGG